MSTARHRGETAEGKYRLIAPLGQGGTATVWLAVAIGPSDVNKLVVLKTLKKELANDQAFREMFLNEARLSARINHPNVVQTYGVVDEGGPPVIVMEYLDGQTLANILSRAQDVGALLPLRIHLKIISELLSGLHYCHELTEYDGKPLNLVHRDASPHNMFVTFAGHMKVLDFGIAKLGEAKGETETGVIKGKFRYMPREQLEGARVDRRADVFAVGVMLWEAAAGEKMWKGMHDAAIMAAVLSRDVPSPRTARPGVPDELARICAKALASEARDRYASASDMQADIDVFIQTLGPVPTHREIGNILTTLFASERLQMKDLIERTLSGAVTPPSGAHADESPGIATLLRSISEAPPATSSGHQTTGSRYPAKIATGLSAATRVSTRVTAGSILGVAAIAGAAAWWAGHGRQRSVSPPLVRNLANHGERAADSESSPSPRERVAPAVPAEAKALACTEATKFIYVVSESDNAFYSFNPSKLKFTKIGAPKCPTSATVNSMSVDRRGTAWVNYREEGAIYKVNVQTMACQPTGYISGAGLGYSNAVSLSFVADGRGSNEETLYISDQTGDDTGINNAKGVAKIDLATMKATPIGSFSDGLAGARCELTGTNDGSLFGFFAQHPAVLTEIDKASGETHTARSLATVDASKYGYAFAFWGGYFWFFTAAHKDETIVTRFDPKTGASAVVMERTGLAVVGAAASSCDPREMADADVTVRQIAAGDQHTCALLEKGTVRCWGDGAHGQLGYASTADIGDDETPASAGDVEVGGVVRQITAGGSHTCALLEGGGVRCWGDNAHGQLGYGNTADIGDDETPASAGDVPVGAAVREIVAGGSHTCALLESGKVRCWGLGKDGQLGYGNTNDVGDRSVPNEAGNVDVGGAVSQITAGTSHTCALLSGGTVRCWGSSADGRLGYDAEGSVGDDETPASVGDVDVGDIVQQVAAGQFHTCALLVGGRVRCWGAKGLGRLGYGSVGTQAMVAPATLGDVRLGAVARQVAPGGCETCALLGSGRVRCWGCRLDKRFHSFANVGLGGVARQIVLGGAHACALLDRKAIRCWGDNSHGQLGYGNTINIEEDEMTSERADVQVF